MSDSQEHDARAVADRLKQWGCSGAALFIVILAVDGIIMIGKYWHDPSHSGVTRSAAVLVGRVIVDTVPKKHRLSLADFSDPSGGP